MSTETLQFLIVEDDEDDFLHLRQLLKKSLGEADVERAATAEAAMAMANDHPHDLCFVDYRLGDKDGLDILRELRNIDVAAPVIFLTGQGDEEVAVQAMKAGATDYLLKSKLNAQSLESAVRHALTLGREQEAVRVARRALGASEQRFRALVENSSDAITLLDAQGTIIYTSRSTRGLLGYAPEELVETSAFELLHPEDEAGARATFQAILQAPGIPFRLEYRSRHKDDQWRFLEAIGVNRLQEPAVGAVVINVRDVTERRLSEDKLRKVSSAVEQSADMVVMTGADGVIEYVNPAFERLTGYTREEVVEKTPRILKSGRQDHAYYERMWATLLSGQVFRDVLVNRKKSGELYWEEKTITPVLDEHGKVRHFISNDRDITERRTAEEALRSSEQRYRLLFERNLAGVFRTSAEGKFTDVNVLPGEHVMLTVSDTGCGIPADILPRIFEPFFTTKGLGKGTGLGLPTVYGIVKQSGGSIWVYSEVDRGTVFKVYLPRAEAAEGKNHEERPASPPPRGSETVLMVEDEEAVRESTCEYLSSRGYDVLQGKNGADALQVLEQFAGKIHLLISDVIMPGMSGAELGKRVRELRPDIRVIYISGYTESTVVQNGVEAKSDFSRSRSPRRRWRARFVKCWTRPRPAAAQQNRSSCLR